MSSTTEQLANAVRVWRDAVNSKLLPGDSWNTWAMRIKEKAELVDVALAAFDAEQVKLPTPTPQEPFMFVLTYKNGLASPEFHFTEAAAKESAKWLPRIGYELDEIFPLYRGPQAATDTKEMQLIRMVADTAVDRRKVQVSLQHVCTIGGPIQQVYVEQELKIREAECLQHHLELVDELIRHRAGKAKG